MAGAAESSEHHGWAMGCELHLVVDGIPPSAAAAVPLLEQLEQLWSRFRTGSDVTRLNSAGGRPLRVAPETVELLDLARQAWELTGGLFDPTVHDAVAAAGYDRSFEVMCSFEVMGDTAHGADLERRAPVGPAPGCRAITLGPGPVARLPRGLHLDLGGIGKGRAADLAADLAIERGAMGVLVSLGGDLRVAGTPPGESSPDGLWRVAVRDPFEVSCSLATVVLASGAVATSSTRQRRWATPNGEAHHLIDPRTGSPAASGVSSVTVVATEAAWAEVMAKSALIAGVEEGLALLSSWDLAGLMVTDDGRLLATERFVLHLDPGERARLVDRGRAAHAGVEGAADAVVERGVEAEARGASGSGRESAAA